MRALFGIAKRIKDARKAMMLNYINYTHDGHMDSFEDYHFERGRAFGLIEAQMLASEEINRDTYDGDDKLALSCLRRKLLTINK